MQEQNGQRSFFKKYNKILAFGMLDLLFLDNLSQISIFLAHRLNKFVFKTKIVQNEIRLL